MTRCMMSDVFLSSCLQGVIAFSIGKPRAEEFQAQILMGDIGPVKWNIGLSDTSKVAAGAIGEQQAFASMINQKILVHRQEFVNGFPRSPVHFFLDGVPAQDAVLNNHVASDVDHGGISLHLSQDVFFAVIRIQQHDHFFSPWCGARLPAQCRRP